MFDVSAVMLNYNSKYFPKMCVEAFYRADMEGVPFEFIAVDNGSTENVSLGYLEKASEKGLPSPVPLTPTVRARRGFFTSGARPILIACWVASSCRWSASS